VGRFLRTPDGEVQMRTTFMAQAFCRYEGKFELGGKRYHVMLGDKDANGRFDDPVKWRENRDGSPSYYALGDQVFLTTGEKVTSREFLYFAPHLVIGETLYDVELDPAHSVLRITPSRAETAPLELSTAVTRMNLISADSSRAVMLFEPGRSAAVPAAEKYRFYNYQIVRRDPQGDLWSISANCTAETPFVELGAGGARLEFGEPFVATAEVPEYSRKRAVEANSSAVQIQFQLRGAAQERVSNLTHVEGEATETPLIASGSKPREPSYRVLEASGRLAASGSFEYG
jgi:hypothetical protein